MFAPVYLWLVGSTMTQWVTNARRILSLLRTDAARAGGGHDKLQDFVAKFGVIAWQLPMLYKDESVILALSSHLKILRVVVWAPFSRKARKWELVRTE